MRRETAEGIRDAFGRGDGDAVHHAAHRLANTVLYLIAPAALEATRRLERLDRTGALADALQAIEELSRQINLLKLALAPHRKRVGSDDV